MRIAVCFRRYVKSHLRCSFLPSRSSRRRGRLWRGASVQSGRQVARQTRACSRRAQYNDCKRPKLLGRHRDADCTSRELSADLHCQLKIHILVVFSCFDPTLRRHVVIKRLFIRSSVCSHTVQTISSGFACRALVSGLLRVLLTD